MSCFVGLFIYTYGKNLRDSSPLMAKLPSYLERQWNTFHVTLKIPKDVQPFFRKTKFYKSLETDSIEEANIKKLPVIANWKIQIKVARKTIDHNPLSNADELVAYYKAELKANWVGFEEEGLSHLAGVIDETYFRDWSRQTWDGIPQRLDTSAAEKEAAFAVYKRVSGEWCATNEYIEEFVDQARYTKQTADECNRSLKLFTNRFRVFETITQREIEAWVLELLDDTKIRTVKKKIGFVRSYWSYCYKNHYVEISHRDILSEDIYPIQPKTKATITAKVKSRRRAFTVDDYHKLKSAKPNDVVLCNLITLAAYTGCRREELCAMPLQNVTDDRFLIEDAKSEAGWREIPIHSEIKLFVASLVKESQDGYLLSGLDGSRNKYGKRGNAIGKRFLRLRSKFYNDQYVFHSFRKTLATQMMTAGVPEAHAAQIIGHDVDTMTYGLYGEDIGFEAKVAAMEKCSYALS